MAVLMKEHGRSLDDESLRTLLCEVEAVANSRPLTTETLSDPLSLLPLTASTLLTGKTKLILPPPGICFKDKMFIPSDTGGMYSILHTSSGAGGAKNIYRAYKQDKGGYARDETTLKVILFF